MLRADEAEEADEQQQQQQPQERGRLAAEAHVVTEEEAAAARYSIDEVVLPLPGCRVEYPRHSTAQVSRNARRQVDLFRSLCFLDLGNEGPHSLGHEFLQFLTRSIALLPYQTCTSLAIPQGGVAAGWARTIVTPPFCLPCLVRNVSAFPCCSS